MLVMFFHIILILNLEKVYWAYAEEKRNVFNIAQSFGYKPKTTSPADVVLDVFQTVPALNGKPDYRYALTVDEGTQVNVLLTEQLLEL